MKLILTTDVKNLGKKDEMVQVSDGYGRNYLIPRGLAVEATAANINQMKDKQNAAATKQTRERAKTASFSERSRPRTSPKQSKSSSASSLTRRR